MATEGGKTFFIMAKVSVQSERVAFQALAHMDVGSFGPSVFKDLMQQALTNTTFESLAHAHDSTPLKRQRDLNESAGVEGASSVFSKRSCLHMRQSRERGVVRVNSFSRDLTIQTLLAVAGL